MPTSRHRHDERYEILIEREARGELSDQEKTDLEKHVATCEQCRSELSQTMKEFDSMTSTTDIFVERFDFDKARRGIENYLQRSRHRWWLLRLSIPALVIFSVVLAVAVSIWLALVIVGQFVAVAGILMFIDHRRNRRIRASLQSNDSSLVDEYARHLHRAGIDRVGRELLIAAGVIVWIASAVDAISNDHWILAGSLIVGAALLLFVLRTAFSRAQRERDRLLVEGEISFDEFCQTGPVRAHDDMDKG